MKIERKNQTFLEWMYYIKSIYYCSVENNLNINSNRASTNFNVKQSLVILEMEALY